MSRSKGSVQADNKRRSSKVCEILWSNRKLIVLYIENKDKHKDKNDHRDSLGSALTSNCQTSTFEIDIVTQHLAEFGQFFYPPIWCLAHQEVMFPRVRSARAGSANFPLLFGDWERWVGYSLDQFFISWKVPHLCGNSRSISSYSPRVGSVHNGVRWESGVAREGPWEMVGLVAGWTIDDLKFREIPSWEIARGRASSVHVSIFRTFACHDLVTLRDFLSLTRFGIGTPLLVCLPEEVSLLLEGAMYYELWSGVWITFMPLQE